jgi:hypothetical protein
MVAQDMVIFVKFGGINSKYVILNYFFELIFQFNCFNSWFANLFGLHVLFFVHSMRSLKIKNRVESVLFSAYAFVLHFMRAQQIKNREKLAFSK